MLTFFVKSLDMGFAHLVEVIPCGRQGPVYPVYPGLHSQCHCHWWHGDARSQVISSYSIDLVVPERSGFSIRRASVSTLERCNHYVCRYAETEMLFWRNFDNFRCSQWRQFRQIDDISVPDILPSDNIPSNFFSYAHFRWLDYITIQNGTKITHTSRVTWFEKANDNNVVHSRKFLRNMPSHVNTLGFTCFQMWKIDQLMYRSIINLMTTWLVRTKKSSKSR